MSTLYRAQILLDPEQHQALAEIARHTGRSISQVVRDILREHLAESERNAARGRALNALKALDRIREELTAQHGVLQRDFVAEARAEREAGVDRVLGGKE